MDSQRARRISRLALAAAAVLSGSLTMQAWGQSNYTWSGGSSSNNDWGSGTNWVGGNAPVLNSIINFAGNPPRTSPNYNYGNFDPMHRIFFNSGATTFTLTGNSMKLVDFGGAVPKIENSGSNSQNVQFANIAFNSTGEINPVEGDINVNLNAGAGNIFLDNNATLNIFGNSGHTVTFDAIIANGGGSTGNFGIRHNSFVVFNKQNSYTGSTAVEAGTLLIGAGGRIANNTGGVFIGNGGTGTLPGLGTLYANTDGSVFMSASGLTLGNSLQTNKADTGAGFGTGKRRIGGTFTSGSGTFTGNLVLNGGAVLTSAGGGTVAFTGIISNGSDGGNISHKVTKEGSGTVLLTNTNTYDGGTDINGGVLRITSAGALGGGQVTVSNATLELGNTVVLTSPSLTLNDGATLRASGGVTYNKSMNPAFGSGATATLATINSGDILLIQSGYSNVAGSTITPTINISNPTGGRVHLASGASGFRGNWVVQSGTLQGSANSNTFGIGNTSGSLTGSTVTLAGGNLEVRGAGTDPLTYNAGTAGAEVPMKFSNDGTAAAGRSTPGAGVTHVFGGLTLGNNSNVNATFTHTTGVTSGTSAFTFGAVTLDGNATVTVNKPNAGITSEVTFGAVGQTGGTRSLTKSGPGQLNLTAANSYSGNTTISGGTLSLSSGATLASPTISVGGGASWNVSAFASGYDLASTQTVNGTGTVAGGLNIAGTIAPGTSVGLITTGNEEWQGGGTYEWELTDATGSAGVGFDQIVMQSLTISASNTSKFKIKIIGSSPANFNPNPPAPGFYSWRIATTTGVTGFDMAKFNLDSFSFTPVASGGHFRLIQTGNDIDLVYVPEPSGICGLVMGAGLLMRRRRGKSQ